MRIFHNPQQRKPALAKPVIPIKRAAAPQLSSPPTSEMRASMMPCIGGPTQNDRRYPASSLLPFLTEDSYADHSDGRPGGNRAGATSRRHHLNAPRPRGASRGRGANPSGSLCVKTLSLREKSSAKCAMELLNWTPPDHLWIGKIAAIAAAQRLTIAGKHPS
jgi:hypothetical protein